MTPKPYESVPILDNEGESKEIPIKTVVSLFDETLNSNLYRKMTYLCVWSQNPIRNVFSMFQLKEVLELTEFVFRKFREVKLFDTEFDEQTPRNKKRKIEDLESPKTEQNVFVNVRPDTPTLVLPSDNLSNVQDVSLKQETHGRRTLENKSQNKYKNRIREFSKDLRLFKRRSLLKKKYTFHITKSKALFESVMLPLKYAHSLSHLFNGCINFVPVSLLAPICDIDVALKAIVKFGKITCVQDHWIEKRTVPTRWMGALVTYKRPSDSQRALAESYSHTFSGLIPVDVKNHLLLIAQMEIKLMMTNSKEMQGSTSVVIDKIPHRASREKLRKDLELYGELVYFKWTTEKGTRWDHCEVAYRFSVEAFAAALALDGKRFYRSTLKTKLKTTEKLRRLHLMVSGSFS